MIKFIHCNVNGIQKQNDPDGLPQIIHQFQSHQADIISINETNTDTSQSQIHYDLIQQFKQQDKHAQISFSHSTREQSKSRYKPGGTMIALLNKWASRYHSKGKDPQGRWSWIIMNGKKSKKILLISAYRVCQSSPKQAGPQTAFMQQYRHQLHLGYKQPQPRRQILTDLLTFIKQQTNKYNDLSIIIMTDANEDIKDTGQFYNFLHQNNLHDAIKFSNPTHASQPTTIHSERRIDYILTTEDLLPSISSSGHYQPHELISATNHCAIYITIPSNLLFDSTTVNITHPATRQLRLHKRSTVE